MVGGPAQLSLQGSQDKYLHLKAFHSFFAASHTTYENFAIESIEISPQGNADFGRRATFQIDGTAELICGGAVEITLPAVTGAGGQDIAWIHSIGHYIYEKMEFKGQGQILDTQYSEYVDMWSRLSVPASKRMGYKDMIGELNLHDRFVSGNLYPDQYDANAPQVFATTKPQTKILIPLNFWWCKDYSQSLPIGVLLYTKITLDIYFRAANQCYVQQGGVATLSVEPSLVDVKLFIDYVFLDDAARNRIARDAHFYVYKQTQHQGARSVTGTTDQYRLPFVLPVCHLMFGVREVAATAVNIRRFDWWDRYAGNNGAPGLPANIPDSPFDTVELKINAQQRFTPRDYLYWARYQPYLHHTSIPESRGIWLFSFALRPEEADASGAANLSRSENNFLLFRFNNDGNFGVGGSNGGDGEVYVFATNYNYIYIEAGFLTPLYNA